MQNKLIITTILIPSLLSILITIIGFYLIFSQNKKYQELILDSGHSNHKLNFNKDADELYIKRELKNTLAKHVQDIQNCYVNLMQSSSETKNGRLHLDWRISMEGSVSHADVIFNELKDDEFAKCVLQVISAIEFPPPLIGREQYIEYTYNFTDIEQN